MGTSARRALGAFTLFVSLITPALAQGTSGKQSRTSPVQLPSVVEGHVKLEGVANLSSPAFIQLFREYDLVQEMYTDLEGRFRFSDIYPGYYRVLVRLEGYKEWEERVYVLGLGGMQRHLTAYLKRLGTPEAIPNTPVVSAMDLSVPERAAKEYQKATERYKAKDFSSGIKHFKKAIELHPSFVQAYNDLGLCYRSKGQLDFAEKTFEEAIRINGKFILPYLNLADIYAASGRRKEARQLLEEAIARNPQEGEPHFVLGKLYFDQGDLDQAEAACRKSHELRHRTADVHLLLAKIYLQRKQYTLIVRELETYLREEPNGTYAQQVQANLERIKTVAK